MKESNPKFDALVEALNDYDTTPNRWKLIDIWNRYTQDERYDDETIFSMSEIDDWFYRMSASEILEQIDKSTFDVSDEYFHSDIYGLSSFSDVFDIVDVERLAEHLLRNDEAYGYNDIRNILDEE